MYEPEKHEASLPGYAQLLLYQEFERRSSRWNNVIHPAFEAESPKAQSLQAAKARRRRHTKVR